ncbi:MAG: putative ABC transport system permease protein [Limisphaerales bacterium]|jgi:putative ABC transport system permease protein
MWVLARVVKESFILVIKELKSNVLRSLLSLLGVTIGIFCIIAVLSAVDSLKRNLETSLDKLGSNVLYVQKWAWTAGEGEEYPWWEYMRRPIPDYQEYKYLAANLEGADAVVLQTQRNSRRIKFSRYSVRNVAVSAVTNEYDKIYDLEFKNGRWISPVESHVGKNVVVLGANVASELFPDQINAIGKEITILGKKVRVIGVLAKEGESIIDFSNDNTVLIPYEFLRGFSKMDGPFADNSLMIEASEEVSNEYLKNEIIPLMRAYRKLKPMENNDFSINEVTLATNALKPTFAFFNIAGFIIGGFSLLVGGFGIANIMFVSVRDRTPMIGVKKALGAKKHYILLEFLLESILLCLMGCVIGLLLVWGVLNIAERATDFKFVMSAFNIIIGVSISSVIGVLFGFIPAYIAANMDPVEAIRK